MLELPEPGLYRTTQPMPGKESEFPANVLVYVGNEGGHFVVRPGDNRRNEWFYGQPTTPLRSPSWAKTLKRLPPQGFYTTPEDLSWPGGGFWPKNAVVQLGYNEAGEGILFVAHRESDNNTRTQENKIYFETTGMKIDDSLLGRLIRVPAPVAVTVELH